MIVVQDKYELVLDNGDFIEQSCQNRFGWRWLGGFERRQHPCSDTGKEGLQSRDEVSQKARGGVIPCVQR